MLEKVKELHEYTGYVHRDIKPDNFRVRDGSACLIDFGAAKSF